MMIHGPVDRMETNSMQEEQLPRPDLPVSNYAVLWEDFAQFIIILQSRTAKTGEKRSKSLGCITTLLSIETSYRVDSAV